MNTATVVERAAQMLDDPGAGELSLASVAESFGVRPPSLYRHVDGLPALRRAIMLRAKEELAQELGRATVGLSRDDAVRELAGAYRQWALAHPGQYPLTVRAPRPGDEDDAAVSSAILEVVFAVLAGYGLREDDAVDATRFLRSALHGFVALETGGAFELPVNVEQSFTRLTDSVAAALTNWSSARGN
ncbi:WHG domain-containing protein [Salinibacterium sp. SYSU T00001]|uniref:TetR-like C-terminal domain-containing protein n=1 Tax=Homoserinimonas sedimenticola TaxID=2986805 RepID=UPI0022363B6D|nr:TetR-like C-terminal domain-containing protein [Salinibacterium sedimenticola]MCW4386345.1 WHG domain-containing protein [Salinibacterium sedimenticola]